jgi:hypothetical protein
MVMFLRHVSAIAVLPFSDAMLAYVAARFLTSGAY